MDETAANEAGPPARAGTPGARRLRRGKTVLVIRSVIAVLLVALAVVNLARGRVLLGVLFGGLAAANVALTLTMVRRRNEIATRFAARRQSAGA